MCVDVPKRIEVVPSNPGLGVANAVLVGAHHEHSSQGEGECESSEEQEDGVGTPPLLGRGFSIEMHVLRGGIRQRPAGRLVRHYAGFHRPCHHYSTISRKPLATCKVCSLSQPQTW